MAAEQDDGIFHSPDLDDEKPLNLVLFDEDLFEAPEGGAELKTPFITQSADLGGEKQGLSVISERISDNELIVQCDLSQVIHGTYVKDGSPATLLVFQFCFVPLRNHRRFKEAEISITFSAGDVQAISPANTWATFMSQTQQEVSHSISPALEGLLGPGKASLGYTWQFKENREVVGYARVVGITQTLGLTGPAKRRKNTILWGLYENDLAKPPSGIASFMQAAALVKRTNNDEFAAEITISGKVDSRKWVTDKWDSVTRNMSNSRKPMPVIFDPTKNRGTVKDIENLGAVDLKGYKQLVTIRTWNEGPESPAEKIAEKPAEGPGEGPGQTAAARSVERPVGRPSQGPKDTETVPRERIIAQSTDSVDADLLETARLVTSPSSALPPTAVQEPTPEPTPLSDNKKTQRLNNLQMQLSVVREEKKLLQEERRLLREIMQLMD